MPRASCHGHPRPTPGAAAVALLVAVFALSSCGGTPAKPAPGPSAAEPANAPGTHSPPAGRLIEIGSSPEGIVVDPRTGLVVVAVRNPPELVLLDSRSERIVRRIPIAGAARHLQAVARSGVVLVPEESANTLLELRLPDARTRSIAVGAHPHDASAVGSRVFVGDEFGRAVTVLEGARTISKIGGFLQPGGVTEVGADLAVVDVRGNSLTLIEARSLRIAGRLPAGAGPTHAVSQSGRRIYVIDTRGGAVLSYLARPKFAMTGRLALSGAPYGVAIDRLRDRLWVTLSAENRLVELSTRQGSPRIVREYPTARQPNSVAVDQRSGRVFVADAGSGVLQVIDPR